MAKSKQQKQEEALTRKRQNYNLQTELWKQWQTFGDHYAAHVKRYGVEEAEKRRGQADDRWNAYLKEARLDAFGDPIDGPRQPREHDAAFVETYTEIKKSGILFEPYTL